MAPLPDDTALKLSNAKAACVAHRCPECGKHESITVEQVIVGNLVVTECHCRDCGFSWHPVVTT